MIESPHNHTCCKCEKEADVAVTHKHGTPEQTIRYYCLEHQPRSIFNILMTAQDAYLHADKQYHGDLEPDN